MSTIIDIVTPPSSRPPGLAGLRLVHRECQGVPMVKHRNPMTDQFTLQCVCGLILRVAGAGPAAEVFEQVGRDGQSRVLPPGTYASSGDEPIEVDRAAS